MLGHHWDYTFCEKAVIHFMESNHNRTEFVFVQAPLGGVSVVRIMEQEEFLKDKNIDKFYCSPYKRSMDTMVETAKYYGKEIILNERF